MDRHGDRDNIYDIYQGMNTMNRTSDTGQEKKSSDVKYDSSVSAKLILKVLKNASWFTALQAEVGEKGECSVFAINTESGRY